MPFTFSHPAAVLPARFLPQRLVSMTALVVGSITPDFEYFIRLRSLSLYSHTWLGLFWFDLPLGFLLTFAYHLLVRDTLIKNLPHFARSRFHKFTSFNWREYFKSNPIKVILCLLIGSATHILWDGFTHPGTYIVKHSEWLRQNTMVFGVGHTNFHILQVVSSVIGGALVIYALLKVPADPLPKRKMTPEYWLVVLSVAVLVIIPRALWGLDGKSLNDIEATMVFTTISGCILGLILAPFIIRKKA